MAIVSVNINQEQSEFQGNNSPSILVCGVKSTLGLANEGQVIEVNGENDIINNFGATSHIAQALRYQLLVNDNKYFLGTDRVKIYGLAVNEESTGTQSSRTLTLAGTTFVAHTRKITVYDEYLYTVLIDVLEIDTITTLGVKIKAAFDNYNNFPFTTTISGTSGEILTFTSILKGSIYKDFVIAVDGYVNGLTLTIGNITNGTLVKNTMKAFIKNAIDNQTKRFWYINVDEAFLTADATIYDLITSYSNYSRNAKQLQLIGCKFDTKENLTSFLAGFNNKNISYVIQSTLTGSNAKGKNLISEFNVANIITGCYARKNTIDASVSDLGLQGSGQLANLPLSIAGLVIPYINIQSEFTNDDIIALSDLNAGILVKNNDSNYVSLLQGIPDHRTTLKTLTNGANAIYKYFGDVDNQAYCQDYLQNSFNIDFFKKTITSQNIKNDNQINKNRAVNLIIYRLQELGNLGLIAYSDEVEERLINELNSSRGIIINYINKSITGSSSIAFIQELLSVIFNIVPLSNYND
jgi:hypothetical protein